MRRTGPTRAVMPVPPVQPSGPAPATARRPRRPPRGQAPRPAGPDDRDWRRCVGERISHHERQRAGVSTSPPPSAMALWRRSMLGAVGHASGPQGRVRQHQGILRDRPHRRPQEDRRADPGHPCDDDQIVPIEASARRSVDLVSHATLKEYPCASHGLFATQRMSSTPICWLSSGPEPGSFAARPPGARLCPAPGGSGGPG